MKKFVIMLAALLMAGTVTMSAQSDKKDKAAAKAEKAEKKAKAKAEKADKKAAAAAKAIAEYDEYVKTYKPMEKTNVPDADLVIEQINTISEGMNNVYSKIGYIEIETEEIENELGEKVQGIKRIYNKNTNEDIDKATAAKNFKEVAPAAAEMATKTAALAPSLAKINPMNMVAIAPQAKELLKRGKMLVKVIPAINSQIKKNNEILSVK